MFCIFLGLFFFHLKVLFTLFMFDNLIQYKFRLIITCYQQILRNFLSIFLTFLKNPLLCQFLSQKIKIVVEFSKRKNYVISPFINLTDVNWRQINELVKQFTRFDQILSKIIIYDVSLLFIIWHVFFHLFESKWLYEYKI